MKLVTFYNVIQPATLFSEANKNVKIGLRNCALHMLILLRECDSDYDPVR